MRIEFNHYAIYKNNIYFYDAKRALIGMVNITSGEINYMSGINNFNAEFKGETDLSVCNNGKIYILRSSGEELIVYHIEYNSCEYIPLDFARRGSGNCAYLCTHGDEIYIFPRFGNEVIQVKKNSNVKKICCPFTNVGELMCGQKIGEKVYLFYRDGSEVLEVSLHDFSAKVHTVSVDMKDVKTCAHGHGQIWILNSYGSIYAYNLEKNDVEYFSALDGVHKKDAYYRIICTETGMVLLPFAADDIVRVGIKDKGLEIYKEYPEELYYFSGQENRKYIACCEDELFYYLLRCSNYMLKISKGTGKFTWVRFKYPSVKEQFCTFKSYNKLEFSENIVSLQDMIQENIIGDRKRMGNESIGKSIWQRTIMF